MDDCDGASSDTLQTPDQPFFVLRSFFDNDRFGPKSSFPPPPKDL